MKKNILWISLLLLSLASLQAQQTLVVNEIMASNSHSASDGSGEFEDWFEIYNASSTTINLAGYYLSDDAANPKKYKVPAGSGTTQIPAGGFLVIWASEAINRGPLHTNFKLSANGEQVIITSPDGITTVNSVTFGSQKTDVSYGRKPDGSNDWLYFVNPTAGSSNNAVAGLAELLKAPSFSQPGGFYAQNINLSISSQDQGTMIYYTLDGSEPTPDNLTAKTFTYKNQYPEGPNQGFGPLLSASYQSYVYTGPLTISDQSSSSNKLSVKSSTANYDPNFYFPTSPVFKGTVVKAKAYKANALPSETITQTFFITPNPNRYSIPVVSVSLEEKHLFDYNQGIYTAGVTFDNKRIEDPNFFATEFCTKGNFTNEGEAWERNGNVEFFSTNTTVINQPVGLRIHGGCSSSIFRKSLRLYSDSEFDYPLFTDRPSTLAHKRLILRSGGNDYKYSLLTDAFMQKMVRHLPVATQANRAAVVFLNGEYWGVHTLDERYDKYYFNKLYRVATDSLDLLTLSLGIEVDEGDQTTYDAFYNYFANNNPVNYTYVKTLMDVENFTDYYIAEIFSSNTDWPHNNQVLWRKRVTPGTPTNHYGNDGRWRWALKDMDYGLGLMNQSNHNTLATATDNGVFGGYTRYLRRLLDIDEFKVYFINRFADLLNTTFNPTRTSAMLTEMKNEYSPAMQEHFTRWPEGNTYQGWLTNVEKIRTFIQQRPDFVREHIRNKFGLPANYNLTLGVSNTEQGYIKINTIELVPSTAGVSQNPYPWTGSYFQGNPIKVTARSRVGYKFMHWKEANTIISTDSVYTIASLNSARSLEAVFASDAVIKVTPTPYALAQCDYRMESWSSSATAGTYPPHMQFVHMSTEDPTLVATVADTVLGLYNHTSRTRLNGLNENGFSFINTSVDNTNPGYIPGRLGGALLALNTQNITEAQVQWTGGTVTANTRPYRIRLRYRVGNSGDFQDLLDNQSNPIEYVRNITGHSQMIGPVALPTAILNKPYVQLLWQYYFMGTGSGARDQLRVDDIIITRGKCESVASGIWSVASTWSCGRIPTVCDAVTIRSGHTVKAQKLVTLGKSLQIENGGVLQYFEPNATLNVSTNL